MRVHCIEVLAQFWQLNNFHVLQERSSTACGHARLQAKLSLTTEKSLTFVQSLEYVMNLL